MEPRHGGSGRAGAIQALWAVEQHIRECGLDHALLRLVQERATQLNAGEPPRDTSDLTERERAALEWTEALMGATDADVLHSITLRVRRHFSEEQLINLSLAVVAMNGWNRLGITRHIRNGNQRAA